MLHANGVEPPAVRPGAIAGKLQAPALGAAADGAGLELAEGTGREDIVGVSVCEGVVVKEGVGDSLAPGDSVALGVIDTDGDALGVVESVGPMNSLVSWMLPHAPPKLLHPIMTQHGSRMQGTPVVEIVAAVVSRR